MNDEQIIRDEAGIFAERYLVMRNISKLMKTMREVKTRLNDFYTSESKSIFLDEIKNYVTNKLQEHRNLAHGGQADSNCAWEKKAEKLLFYIRQELGTLPTVAHQKNPTTDTKQREGVFVSYSHADEAYLEDIKKHFKPFLGEIDFWDDSKILAGQKWREEIEKAIGKVKVAILLVSADFLASDFITNSEVPPLLKAAEEKGATILTVILRPCLFDMFPKLNQFQAMNPPSKPVSRMDENDKEDLYTNLVRQTKRLLRGK